MTRKLQQKLTVLMQSNKCVTSARLTHVGLGFENKQHLFLALCKTMDAFSGSEAFVAQKVMEKKF